MVNNKKSRATPVALVTGGAGGLGRALCLRLAEAGYCVCVNYRNSRKEALRAVSRIVASGGCAHAIQADVGNSVDVGRMFQEIAMLHGRLDVLIHAAGIVEPAVVVKMSEEQFDSVIRIHLKGAFLCTQAAARIMKRRRRGGSIVYIGSVMGVRGSFGGANYAAAKAGLMGLAKTAARELGGDRICVNVALPGFMETALNQNAHPILKRTAKAQNVFHRFTDPMNSARMIVELCRSPWISGQVLNFDARIL